MIHERRVMANCERELDKFSDSKWHFSMEDTFKFWRMNRSYLGRGVGEGKKGGKELFKNNMCKNPRKGECTEYLRTWTKTRVADCREQTGEWPEMRWERAYGKDAGLYPTRTGKPLEVFKQGTDMVRFVLYDHSWCSGEGQRGSGDQHGR